MSSKVITIAQQKGGAGKTTLAAHLAVVWSQRGMKVAVIDTDPQASLSEWHKLREERFGEEYTGLSFMHLSGWRLGSEISRMRRMYDVILIDSPPHTETDAKTAIRNADLIVIPVQPSPTDLWATKATIDIAKSERVPYRVVLNRYQPNTKLAANIVSKLENLTEGYLGNRVNYAASLLEGRTVTETMPKSPAAEEVKQLSKEIWKVVCPPEKPAKEAKEAKQVERELEDA